MDIKKIAVGIIFLGILITCIGIIAAVEGGDTEGTLDTMFADEDAAETNPPYLLLGIGVIILGVIARISAQKKI